MVEIAASLSKEDGLILGELGSVLVGLGIAAFIASRIKFSVVPIFLLAGLFFGNGGIVSLELSDEFLDLGAQWGAILLLLLLGLEYSAQELFESVKKRKSLGVVDLVVNFIPGAVIALILGWGLLGALTLGGISYVSSSGIASQFIKDSRLESQESTRRAVGVLVIEDLFLAPYLPVLSALLASLGLITWISYSSRTACDGRFSNAFAHSFWFRPYCIRRCNLFWFFWSCRGILGWLTSHR
jgi:CPA2 family monovalent cation:H+ antiporter-2